MAMGDSAKHPGFGAIQKRIAKTSGISEKKAGAILASSSRKASPAAKKKNPALKKVPAKKKAAPTKPAPTPVAAPVQERTNVRLNLTPPSRPF